MDKKTIISLVILTVAIIFIISTFMASQRLWCMACGSRCVSNPVGEIISKMQPATKGMVVVTQVLCFDSNSILSVGDVSTRVALESIMFKCDGEVCSDSGLLVVTDSTIIAKGEAEFKVMVECKEAGDESYACNLTVIDVYS